jgi:ferric-dicitrate binding protein FerR (iron transport regulator)
MENNKKEKDIAPLITGFLANSLNAGDLSRLNEWLDIDASHRDEFNQIRSAWIISGHEAGKQNFDIQQGWQKVERNIKSGKNKIFKHFTPLWYAASLLFCFVSGAVVSTWTSLTTVQSISSITSTIIKAPLGSKSNIILPDGSSIWLNAGSVISYPSDFGIEKRNLQLTGEAFFDVKSDSLMPFNVHTSGMTIRALGTRFNVKAYPNDNIIAATLEEGIIDVAIQISSDGKTSEQSVKLKPKEQLVIQKALTAKEQEATKQHTRDNPKQHVSTQPIIQEVIIKPNVKTELSTSWKDNKWIINDEPLVLFASNLERRYNLRIRFASEELKDYKFSGIFEDETVEQILTALSLAAPVNYTFNKNNVILSLNQKDKDKFDKMLRKNK